VYTGRYTDAHGARSEHAYVLLKRQLLSGDVALGERLAEASVAVALGVSRTPVREALARLHAEHLVDRHPHGGYRPAAPDLHGARELYEVRFALEFEALTRLFRPGTEPDLDALTALRTEWAALAPSPVRDEGDPAFVTLDEDFHVRLATAAGNRALVELLVRVNERIRPVRVHDFLTAERIRLTVEQHVGVLDAVLDGDADGARRRLGHHFEESYAVVEQRAAAALARMWSLGRRMDA
jgi:DNA-binding GntR family transcriptional regulator